MFQVENRPPEEVETSLGIHHLRLCAEPGKKSNTTSVIVAIPSRCWEFARKAADVISSIGGVNSTRGRGVSTPHLAPTNNDRNQPTFHVEIWISPAAPLACLIGRGTKPDSFFWKRKGV